MTHKKHLLQNSAQTMNRTIQSSSQPLTRTSQQQQQQQQQHPSPQQVMRNPLTSPEPYEHKQVIQTPQTTAQPIHRTEQMVIQSTVRSTQQTPVQQMNRPSVPMIPNIVDNRPTDLSNQRQQLQQMSNPWLLNNFIQRQYF